MKTKFTAFVVVLALCVSFCGTAGFAAEKEIAMVDTEGRTPGVWLSNSEENYYSVVFHAAASFVSFRFFLYAGAGAKGAWEIYAYSQSGEIGGSALAKGTISADGDDYQTIRFPNPVPAGQYELRIRCTNIGTTFNIGTVPNPAENIALECAYAGINSGGEYIESYLTFSEAGSSDPYFLPLIGKLNTAEAALVNTDGMQPGPWLDAGEYENNFYSLTFRTSVDFNAFKFFLYGDPGAEGSYALYPYQNGKVADSPAAAGSITGPGDNYVKITFEEVIKAGQYKMVLKSTGKKGFCLGVVPEAAAGVEIAAECQVTSNTTPDYKYLLSYLYVVPDGTDRYFLPLELSATDPEPDGPTIPAPPDVPATGDADVPLLLLIAVMLGTGATLFRRKRRFPL
ncbi:MAG: LPXTG cell wall anchor domain-containing protein [Clostridia bacterium]